MKQRLKTKVKRLILCLNPQIRTIRKKTWNYLIVLDACRYDYFRQEWDGNVKCVRSPASATYSWLQKVFPDRYPFIVYSANPFINSKSCMTHWKYQAKDHFAKVVDLWSFGWNEKYGTVLPQTVYKCAKQANPQSIIWLIQPHAPYLTRPAHITSKDFIAWKPSEVKKLNTLYQLKGLRYAYRENLKEALKWVRKLLDVLKPPIIITSDHGELLGEYGRVGHPADLNVPELRNVPLVMVK